MMLEFLVAVTLAGGAMLLFQRYASHHSTPDAVTADGMFAAGTPLKAGSPRPFHEILPGKSGFVLYDAAGDALYAAQYADVRQVNALHTTSSVNGIMLHLETAQGWQMLTLQLTQTDLARMVGMLRRVLPADRINLSSALPDPSGPFQARLVTETLQGEILPEAEVALYAVPPLLVVLKDEKVVAKLDLRTIRRVLAVERSAGRMEAMLNRTAPEGLIRLYSLHETAVFALAAYQELAATIAQVAGCPLEFIGKEGKSEKVKG